MLVLSLGKLLVGPVLRSLAIAANGTWYARLSFVHRCLCLWGLRRVVLSGMELVPIAGSRLVLPLPGVVVGRLAISIERVLGDVLQTLLVKTFLAVEYIILLLD